MNIDSLYALRQRIRNLKFISHDLTEGLYSGGYKSVLKGLGLDFEEVRDYREQDDARFIDWNVTARLGTPYVKVFKTERETQLQLLIDCSLSLDLGSGEQSKWNLLILLVAVFSQIAQNNHDAVGALFFDEQIRMRLNPRKGHNQVSRLLQELLNLRLGEGSNLAHAIQTSSEILRRRSIVVIFSDFLVEGYFKDLAILARRHDVIAVRLGDMLEEGFSHRGFVELQDRENQHLVSFMAEGRFSKQQYHDLSAVSRLSWRKECLRRGIATLEIDTQEDLYRALRYFFRRRKQWGRR